MVAATTRAVPIGRTSRPLSARARQMFWGYLMLVAGSELVTSLVNPAVGLGAHLLTMVALLVHSTIGHSEQERKLALALTLAPMIRLLSLAMPLVNFPQIDWYPIVSIPLLAATWVIVKQTGLKPSAMGFRAGKIGLQLLLIGAGSGLGIIEYTILRPKPIIPSLDWQSLIFACFSLFVFTGLNEEIIFRGLLQATSLPVLGSKGLLYVSLLFGALHIGYLSVADVIFVTAVGLLFSYIVRWGGSLLGVTLAHGMTNVTLFIIMPLIVRDWPIGIFQLAILAGLAGLVAAAFSVVLLRQGFREAHKNKK